MKHQIFTSVLLIASLGCHKSLPSTSTGSIETQGKNSPVVISGGEGSINVGTNDGTITNNSVVNGDGDTCPQDTDPQGKPVWNCWGSVKSKEGYFYRGDGILIDCNHNVFVTSNNTSVTITGDSIQVGGASLKPNGNCK